MGTTQHDVDDWIGRAIGKAQDEQDKCGHRQKEERNHSLHYDVEVVAARVGIPVDKATDNLNAASAQVPPDLPNEQACASEEDRCD
jgi:hypothetical protein